MADWLKVVQFSVRHEICGGSTKLDLADGRGTSYCTACHHTESYDDLSEDDDGDLLVAMADELVRVSGLSQTEVETLSSDLGWLQSMLAHSPVLHILLERVIRNGYLTDRKH